MVASLSSWLRWFRYILCYKFSDYFHSGCQTAENLLEFWSHLDNYSARAENISFSWKKESYLRECIGARAFNIQFSPYLERKWKIHALNLLFPACCGKTEQKKEIKLLVQFQWMLLRLFGWKESHFYKENSDVRV